MSNAPSAPRPNGDSTADPRVERGNVGGQNSRDQARADPAAKPGSRGGGKGDAQPSDAPPAAATPRPRDQHEQRAPGDSRDNFEQPYVQQNLRGGGTSSASSKPKAAPGPATRDAGGRGG